MLQSYRITFLLAVGLIFLVPLFFVPGGAPALSSAKAVLLSVGATFLTLSFIYESWRQGGLSFPKGNFFLVAVLLPVAYLISAAIATPSSLSLLGYSLEVGTFGYMLIGTMALVIASSMTVSTGRHLQALAALFASLSLLALFVLMKVSIGGDFLALGNFFGNMGNPLGSWTDLGVAFGLLASFSALTLGMIPMKPLIKVIIYAVFALSTALLVVIGFSTAFTLTLAASVFLWLYFTKVEKDFFHSSDSKRKFFSQATFLPILLGLISLAMFVNPSIGGATLSHTLSQKFGIENTDVRPTLSATLSVSKAVLSQAGLLGSGPNTFGQDWLIFKPVTVNATPFWGVAFPFGVGFVPTQVASTGILGTTLWLAFFSLLVVLSFKTINKVPESRATRFIVIATLLISLFLWFSAVFYTPSVALLFIAFVFTGFLLAFLRGLGSLGEYSIDLNEASPVRSLTLALLLAVVGGAIWFGSLEVEKARAAYHYGKAVALSNVSGASLDNIEGELAKAAQIDEIDIYFAALSKLNFTKAQTAANSTSGTPEQNRAVFEDALRRSVEAARAAVTANPAAYGNWVTLGSIYAALVPEPLKVEGAYENAQYAYSEAQKRNPNNPELPLFLSRLEIAKDNIDAARSHIRNSLALKEDYADAYLLLAQLEVSQKNIPAAIQSAQALTVLVPNNAGVYFELGVLKHSNGDYNGARESLLEALKLAPDYANAKYYLALAYIGLDMKDEARNQLEDLLATNPESGEVRALIESLNKPGNKNGR